MSDDFIKWYEEQDHDQLENEMLQHDEEWRTLTQESSLPEKYKILCAYIGEKCKELDRRNIDEDIHFEIVEFNDDLDLSREEVCSMIDNLELTGWIIGNWYVDGEGVSIQNKNRALAVSISFSLSLPISKQAIEYFEMAHGLEPGNCVKFAIINSSLSLEAQVIGYTLAVLLGVNSSFYIKFQDLADLPAFKKGNDKCLSEKVFSELVDAGVFEISKDEELGFLVSYPSSENGCET